ncbi:Sporulation kinase E [Aquisphaera giovannonii]|uniref:histidine kinase n=1 Tax=Aquisphaera giovannonii TaxID=406548 RepID=A0A5B9W9T7_9BACT|nr:HAMP domain-containing sensor histidine kinase [Aquisphaera giovannonii]QEH36855.1 Sporulation kinase E [Aquisphaera giovannonii]
MLPDGAIENHELKPLLGHLCSAVGHHVINALSTVVSQGEILRTLGTSSPSGSLEVRDRVETIIRAAFDASTITRKLIGISHDLTAVGFDQATSPVAAIRLDEWLPGFVDEARGTLGPRAEWTLDLSPVPPLLAQPDLLKIMFRLLIQNSLEAMPEGRGTLAFSTRPAPRDWLVVELRDDGAGMTPEVMEHATEPFFTTRPERTGIGLTIARGIWRRHRGSLALEGAPGKGTTIRLLAPSMSVN